MFANKRMLIILMIAVLALPALAILPSAGAQVGPKPEAVGLRPDAPPYALHGPYWVGMKEAVIDPDAERPIPVRVWYPALNPTGIEESIDYPTAVQFFPVPEGVPSITVGHALANAAPDTSQAPYPLVLYSHGFSGTRELGAYLTEHLASYGFVVIAPTHLGEVWGEFWASNVLRPADTSRVIDYAESLTAESGELEGLIDISHLGVAGWSSGGYTAMAAAGARFNHAGFEKWCEEYPESPDAVSNCPDLLAHKQELLALAKLDSAPEGLWPSWGDPRVDAVVAQSGGGYEFGPVGLAAVTVPVMIQVGSNDTSNTPEWSAYLAYGNISSTQKSLVTLENGNHLIFGGKCADNPWILGTDPGMFWVCSDSVWDMDRAHDLINHFTTAFLLATLKGDAEAAAALAPDQVSFPGITYEATGF